MTAPLALALLATALRGPAVTPPASRTSVVFHVATTGSDADPCSLAEPCATMAGAAARLRASAVLTLPRNDARVSFAPGSYWGTAVTITNLDSPALGSTVTYEARDGVNTVNLDGGIIVSGWGAAWSGSIYRTAVAACPWTLYENGVRATLARTPDLVFNAGFPEAQEPNFRAATLHGTGSFTTFEYDPADIPSTASWVVGDVRLNQRVGGVEWWTDIEPIASIDTVNHLFTLGTTPKYQFAVFFPPRYFVENDLSFITADGEFYCDRNDAHGAAGGGLHYLYYRPRATPIASQEIVAPTTLDVVSLAGADAAHPVTGVTLKNLTIRNSDSTSWFRYGESGAPCCGRPCTLASCFGHDPATAYYYYEGQTWTDFRHGAVRMENTSGVVLDGVKVSGAGLSGVFAFFYNEGDTFHNVSVEHAGLNGFTVEGGWPGEGDLSRENRFVNVKTNHVGELMIHGAGLWVTNASGVLSHFELRNGRRDGLFLTITVNIPAASSYMRGFTAELGRVLDHVQDSGDAGCIGIYGVGSVQVGPFVSNTLRQISIDGCRAHPDMLNFAPVGVYFDEQTWGQTNSNVNAIDTAGNVYLLHDSGSHVDTNVVWGGGFNASLMDSANIGLTADFPY